MKHARRSLLVLSLCTVLGSACDETKASADKAAPSKAAADAAPPPKPAAKPALPAPTTAAPVPAAAAAPPPAAASAPAVEPAKPEAKTTPELTAFDETIKSIVDVEDDDARAKALCKALSDRTISAKIRAVGDHPPAGVDATKWRETSESMWGWFNDTEIECGEDSSPNMKVLATVADTRNELDALLPK